MVDDYRTVNLFMASEYVRHSLRKAVVQQPGFFVDDRRYFGMWCDLGVRPDLIGKTMR